MAQRYIVNSFVVPDLMHQFSCSVKERIHYHCTKLMYRSILRLPSFLPFYGATAQIGPWPPPLRFLNHTQLDTR
jgi:hypothetical protein